jgi:hypothetical protein
MSSDSELRDLLNMLRMELSRAKRENNSNKAEELKIEIRKIREKLRENAQHVVVSPLETTNDLIDHGKKIQNDSLESVQRMQIVIEETKQIAGDTANIIQTNTEQLKRVENDLYEIDNMLTRSVKIIKNIGRKIASNKLLWFMIFLIVVGIIAIIITKIK